MIPNEIEVPVGKEVRADVQQADVPRSQGEGFRAETVLRDVLVGGAEEGKFRRGEGCVAWGRGVGGVVEGAGLEVMALAGRWSDGGGSWAAGWGGSAGGYGAVGVGAEEAGAWSRVGEAAEGCPSDGRG
jgi:hypothetical protein